MEPFERFRFRLAVARLRPGVAGGYAKARETQVRQTSESGFRYNDFMYYVYNLKCSDTDAKGDYVKSVMGKARKEIS